MPEISIVIVTHNSEEEIGACLDALHDPETEVIVVDNASGDNTVGDVRSRNVRLIANPDNRGFAAAVNQGANATAAPLLLLLNPDTVLQSSLAPLRAACELGGIGAACGQLLDASGRPQTGFMFRRLPRPITLIFEALLLNRLWPKNPVNWQYRCMDLTTSSPALVEQPAGAFLMVRRDVWGKLGGLDERFHPLWFEDVDFCKRLGDAGYRIRYVPEVVARHIGGHSIRKISLGMRQVYWYGNLLKYSAKHFRPLHVRAVCLAVMIGSMLRMAIGVAHPRGRESLAVYGKVVKLAGRFLLDAGRRRAEVLS